MMRRATTFGFVLPLLLLFTSCGAAETARNDSPRLSALRSLSINRSLLTKAEAEYRDLQKQESLEGNENTSKRLSDLHYKIQALHEDAERLAGTLPAGDKADDFLRELTAARAVNTVSEKRIEEKVRAIYQLHEKALQNVAAQNFETAEKIYEEIVLLSPDDDEAYLLLGHTCLATGHYEKAADAFHSAVHIDPRNAQEITRLYENILMENPSDDEAMTRLGYAHLLLGSVEDARRAFEDAVATNPANIEAKRGLMELSA